MDKTESTINLLLFMVIVLMILTLMQSCTYSVNIVHTQGEASDVVDEQQSAQADISPNIEIPALP